MNHGNVLLRRYLSKRLTEYYSQHADKVIGSIDSGFVPQVSSVISSGSGSGGGSTGKQTSRSCQHGAIKRRSIDFSSLINEWHWKHTYKRVYREQKGMWLTPVELFYPYYSNILANFVSASMTTSLNNTTRDNEGVFDIAELGGGRGTNAIALLDHLSEYHPETYARLRCYTIFDTSPTLHELQKEVLLDGSSHSDRVKLVNVDLMDVAEGTSVFLAPSDTPTAVLALELLDNLPHDKIGRCMVTGDILQAEVAPVASKDPDVMDVGFVGDLGAARFDALDRFTETFSQMNDPLLAKILSIAPSLYAPMVGPRWVPTVALGILMKLLECRPNSSVAFADFDWLPPPDLSSSSGAQGVLGGKYLPSVEIAAGDPLVTDMEGNDHMCYLAEDPALLCDILFPTDFGRLANFASQYLTRCGRSESDANRSTVLAMKQRDFLLKYGSDEVNKTKGWSGHSPLINDFGNCSVLTITPGEK